MLIGFILLIILISVIRIEANSKTENILFASIIWCTYLFVLTELLSVFNLIRFRGIAGGWLIFDIFVLALIMVRRDALKLLFNNFIDSVKVKKALKIDVILDILLIIIAVSVLFLALVTTPYNWDSMTYHLPRIMHWMQNHSVAHYVVNDTRQISSPVLAEFINLNVCVLSWGSDRFFNLLQCGSYIFSAWMVGRIASLLGCNKYSQRIASLLFMTMPIAYAEAINTQVDLFSTTWMLIFVYFFIKVYSLPRLEFNRDNLIYCLGLAFPFGLGYEAKPSVNIGMAILLVILLGKCIKAKSSVGDIIKLLIPSLLVIAVLILPESIRMYVTFGSFSDPVVGARQLVGTLKPNYLIVNMLKNFIHNFPNRYLPNSEQWMARVVMAIATLLRVDINNPAIAEDGIDFIYREVPNYGQDTATNFMVVFLAVLSLIYILIVYHKRDKDIQFKYVVIVNAVFIIFCMLLRWEPYVTRYMVNYLALLCPCVACVLMRINRKQIAYGLTMVISIVCVIEGIFLFQYHKDMWKRYANNRPGGYFTYDYEMGQEYWKVADTIKSIGVKNVGIKLSNRLFEYPLWRMLNDDSTDITIMHAMVENDSYKYAVDSVPDCLIIDAAYVLDDVIETDGASYVRMDDVGASYLAMYSVR